MEEKRKRIWWARFPKETEEKIMAMYADKTKKLSQIASECSIDVSSVYLVLKRNGKSPSRDKEKREKIRLEHEERICDAYNAKTGTVAELSTEFGVSRSAIYCVLKKHNVNMRKRGPLGYKHTQSAKNRIATSVSERRFTGRTRDKNGYVRIYTGYNSSGNRSYVLEHRLIMESILGRPLDKREAVHHINGIRDDNRPENLMIVQHNRHYGEVICPHCLKRFLVK